MNDAILVVDDDHAMQSLLTDELSENGYRVTTVGSAAEALARLGESCFAAMVTDLNLGGVTGLELTRRVLALDPTLPVILITAFGSMEHAIGAIRAGAYDFLTKPFEPQALLLSLERAVALRHLRDEVAALRRKVRRGDDFEFDGNCAAIARLEARIHAVAPTAATCLILGESGTGKTRVAQRIHRLSDRSDAPFVAENVAAIPANLLESELFGHIRGAFTGADADREGLLRRAGEGTLFLDEIGEMPRETQPKLLRALDERRFRPVGSDREVDFKARLIIATNRDLYAEVRAGRFREDLYYRLSVFEVTVPPLRQRGRDVLELAQRFLQAECTTLGKTITGLSPEAARLLLTYGWPGNVRELHNCMAQAAIVTRGATVVPMDLPERLRDAEPILREDSDDPETLVSIADLEREHILRVLHAVNGNKAHAARILGLGRKTLYRKLESYDVTLS